MEQVSFKSLLICVLASHSLFVPKVLSISGALGVRNRQGWPLRPEGRGGGVGAFAPHRPLWDLSLSTIKISCAWTLLTGSGSTGWSQSPQGRVAVPLMLTLTISSAGDALVLLTGQLLLFPQRPYQPPPEFGNEVTQLLLTRRQHAASSHSNAPDKAFRILAAFLIMQLSLLKRGVKMIVQLFLASVEKTAVLALL